MSLLVSYFQLFKKRSPIALIDIDDTDILQIGRDAVIHVWNLTTRATVAVLSGGHERGVCAVDFSADGRRLVSGE